MQFRGVSFIAALATGIFLAAQVQAVPRGNLGTWVESRHFQYGAFARDIDFNTNIFHSDGVWFPDNAGVWTTLLEYTPYDTQFLVDGRNVPTDIGRFSFTLGDFAWETFEDDLRREYRQNTLIRGVSISLQRKLEWHATAGALAERGLFMGTGRTTSGIPVMRLGVGSSWKEKGRWDLSWENQLESRDHVGRQLGTLFGSQKVGEDWTARSEGRLSHNSLGNYGTSIASGISRQSQRVVLGISGRRVSRNFSGIGLYRDPHVNEFGGRIHGAVRLSRSGLTGFFLDLSQDLGKNTLGREPEKRTHARINLSASLVGPLYLQSRITYRDRTTIDSDSLFVDQNTISGRVETGLRGRVVQGYLSYSRGLFRSRLDDEPDWHEDRFESQANVRLGSWFRAQLTGYYADRRLPDGTWTSREKRGEIRLMAEPSEKRRAWLLAGRERQDATLMNFQRDNYLLGAGWYHSLPQGLGFEVEAQVAIDAGSREVESLRWSGRITHNLAFGSGPVRVYEQVEEFGTVSGFIFEDTNENGVRDPLEPGISNQSITLGSGPSMVTRDDGSFYFEKAAILLDFMRFKTNHLASRYLPPDGREFELHLNPGGHRHIDIPVRLAASVHGRVVAVDENGNVRGVPGALIRVSGTHRDAFTNDQGEYVIVGLKSGKQMLEFVDWSVPKNHEIVGSLWKTVILESGKDTEAPVYEIRNTDPVLLQWFKLR